MAPLLLLLDLYERMAATSKRKAQLDEIVVGYNSVMQCHVFRYPRASDLRFNPFETRRQLKIL